MKKKESKLHYKQLMLGIETSCDDTSVALVKDCGAVVDMQKWTYDEDHVHFGGIIPERASRNHSKSLIPLIDKILKENGVEGEALKGVAVTNRPGLQGSLIVGAVTAKTLGSLYKIPVLGINHLEGHMVSPWLYDEGGVLNAYKDVYPQVSLIVSGGHTQLVLLNKVGSYKILGSTRDDAAGEALDKFANLIGLGFPGGPKLDQKASSGNGRAYAFPRPMIKEPHYDFSFSGLKASGARLVESMTEGQELSDETVEDLSASYLRAAVDVLIYKLEKALEEFKPKVFTIVGGVSANSLLRKEALVLSKKLKVPFDVSTLKYCTDNGAMIALAGLMRLKEGLVHDEDFKTHARSLPGDFL